MCTTGNVTDVPIVYIRMSFFAIPAILHLKVQMFNSLKILKSGFHRLETTCNKLYLKTFTSDYTNLQIYYRGSKLISLNYVHNSRYNLFYN